MTMPSILSQARLPIIGAPMFIISNPDLVIAQCKAGMIGSFPALNARPQSQLSEWLDQIKSELAAYDAANPDAKSAPFAVNLIVHKSNERLEEDLATCVKHKVPIVITSLGAQPHVNEAIHSYGGIILHDVITQDYARKAVEKGADGLVLVSAGAGGHAGTQSPFALCQETRAWFDGPIALSGSIATGRSLYAAQVMGADFGYIGSAFIATKEANADERYKQAIVDGRADDIIYTDQVSGIPGNYLRGSLLNAGFDLGKGREAMKPYKPGRSKAWKDIWGAGQGIGPISEVVPVATMIERMMVDYDALTCAGRGAPSNRAAIAQA